MDPTCSWNGQTPTCCPEIPASKKKKPRPSFEETSGWMKEAGTGQETKLPDSNMMMMMMILHHPNA
jgi:hypothetical protein